MRDNGISRIRKLVIALSSAIAFGVTGSCTTADDQAQKLSNEIEAEGVEAAGDTMEAGEASGKKMKKRRKKMGKKMRKKMKKMNKKKMKKVKKGADKATEQVEEAMNTDDF